MRYIYLSNDFASTGFVHGRTKVYLKVGYTHQPEVRGSQLRSQARTMHGITDMPITFICQEHAIPLPSDDKAMALYVETYVLQKVYAMKSTTILKGCREYVKISLSDRERCHKMLPGWVAEGIAKYKLIRGA